MIYFKQLVCIGLLCFQSFQLQGAQLGWKQQGIASWYGGKFQGRLTANGEIFDTYEITAAHKKLPFNTIVKVTNKNNGLSIRVRINDRGPFVDNRIIDLSYAAAVKIKMYGSGVAPVIIEVMKMGDGATYHHEHRKPKDMKLPPHQQSRANSIRLKAKEGKNWIQVAAFSTKKGGLREQLRLKQSGLNAEIFFEKSYYKIGIYVKESTLIKPMQHYLSILGTKSLLLRQRPVVTK